MAIKNTKNTDAGNAIRAALAEKAENGNRSYVKREDVVSVHKGKDTQWEAYNASLIKFETLARGFVERYYNVLKGTQAELDERAMKRDEVLAKINSDIIDEKKALLKWIDPDKKHRCAACDGYVIGEMAHDIIMKRNNVDGEEKFKSRVVHGVKTRAEFRRKLEQYFGIIITGEDVIDPERTHYLRKERSYLSAINSAKKAVEDKRAEKNLMLTLSVKLKASEEARAEQEAEYDEEIAELEKDVETAKKEFLEYRAAHRDQRDTEPTHEEVLGMEKRDEALQAALELTAKMTLKELREFLDEHKVSYPKRARKDDMQKRVAMVMAANAEEAEAAEPEAEEVAEPEQATAEAKAAK